MKSLLGRLSAAIFLGASAPWWWPWVSSNLTVPGYVLAGAPNSLLPPPLAWTIVVAVQLLIGCATGLVLARLLSMALAWTVFHVFLVVGAAAFGDVYAPFRALMSPGGVAFELALITALFLGRRANRSFDADVLSAGFARLLAAGQLRR